MRAVNAVVHTGNTPSMFKAKKATLAGDRKINFKGGLVFRRYIVLQAVCKVTAEIRLWKVQQLFKCGLFTNEYQAVVQKHQSPG